MWYFQHVRQHIAGYLAGTLPKAVHQRVETHLRDCAACREETTMLRKAQELFPSLPPKALSADFTARVIARVEDLPQEHLSRAARLNEVPERARPICWRQPLMFAAPALAVVVLVLAITLVTIHRERTIAANKPQAPNQQFARAPSPAQPGLENRLPESPADGVTPSVPSPAAPPTTPSIRNITNPSSGTASPQTNIPQAPLIPTPVVNVPAPDTGTEHSSLRPLMTQDSLIDPVHRVVRAHGLGKADVSGARGALQAKETAKRAAERNLLKALRQAHLSDTTAPDDTLAGNVPAYKIISEQQVDAQTDEIVIEAPLPK